MIEVNSKHPPGTVGYITGGVPRYFQFFDSLERTKVPTGTKLQRAFSCNPARNSNSLVEHMQGEWLWIQGDDHTWSDDLLLKLLDRDADVIVPLVPRWGPPFFPVIFKEFDPKGNTTVYTWEEIELLSRRLEVITVEAAGSAGMLVKKKVLDAMEKPCFRVGLMGPDELSEDVEFTWKANQLGFNVVADLTCFMGHATSAIITPSRLKNGKLAIMADIHGGNLMAYTVEPFMNVHSKAEVHPTAKIHPSSRVWQFATICEGVEIGKNCVIGSNVWVGKNVKIGDGTRIQHGAFITNGSVLEEHVFIGPNVTFTDDKYPRAGNRHYIPEPPRICHGSSVGANATILPGVVVGPGMMVGAGAVVTESFTEGTVAGVPARVLLHKGN